MRILVRMPNWLGDAVMATPALTDLVQHYQPCETVLVGSAPVQALFSADPRFAAVELDNTAATGWRRWFRMTRLARSLSQQYGPFDLAVAFPNSISSRLMLRLTRARRRAGAARGGGDLLLTDAVRLDPASHQAEKYHQIVAHLTGSDEAPPAPHLHVSQSHAFARPTLGLHPGAAFGEAKRWFPERFAAVAAALAEDCDIVIFGSAAEARVAERVEAGLRNAGVENCRNLAGKTTLPQLVGMIAALQLLITNDSGPMHIASAFRVPTVAVFGSTDPDKTSPWRNPHARLVRRQVPCAPCLQRGCPLEHHDCMRKVTVEEVLSAARSLLSEPAKTVA